MAPFAPFLSDHIFLELKKLGDIQEESVHLCDYPVANTKEVNKDLEAAVERMQQIILLGRQKRNQKQIKVKTPLKSLTVIQQDQKLLDNIALLEEYLKIELNIKEIHYTQDEDKYISLYCKPNSPILGKRLGKKFGSMRKSIEAISNSELKKFEAGQTITVGDEKLSGEDLLVFREPKEGTEALSNKLITIELDCKLDEDLIGEGLAREVVNRIQKTRKEMDFNVADRINIQYSATKELEAIIEKHSEYIQNETLTKSLSKGTHKEAKDFDIEGQNLKLYIVVA